VDEVVDGAEAEGVVEEVAEQFDDAAVGAVADQDQAEGQLPQPGLGDGQAEQDTLGVRVGCREGGVEGLLGLGGLPVDEFAGDVGGGGEGGEGVGGGRGLQGGVWALRGGWPVGRGGLGCGGAAGGVAG